jgi:hypothetical protein
MVQVLIPHWRTSGMMTVATPIAPGRVEEHQREVTEWHPELLRDAEGHPVTLITDDQVGSLPPAEWLDVVVRYWRRVFGHKVPNRTTIAAQRDARTAMLTYAARSPNGPAALGAIAAVRHAYRQWWARTVLLGPDGHAGAYRGRVDERDDPVVDEWELRFGEPPRDRAVAWNVEYLITWLDEACDRDLGMADFAAELRALSAELSRALGEQPDQQWLGRCPSTLTERGGQPRPCGAGIWQDPHASQVECPRCHSTWGPKPAEILTLAREIRRVWPIDRRRRYDLADRERIAEDRPICAACVQPWHVVWRDVTAPADDRRWWRPERITCACTPAEKGTTR